MTILMMSGQTFAQAQSLQNPDVMQQLQKLAGNKDTQKVMAQVMVVGSLTGCTQKIAGEEATNAFYGEMQGVGKQVEAYCKQHDTAKARELLLKTFNAKKDDPVVKAGLSCYEQQKQMVSNVGGPEIAADVNHYSRWLKDPKLAETEMQDNDICRSKKAAPVMPVTATPTPPTPPTVTAPVVSR